MRSCDIAQPVLTPERIAELKARLGELDQFIEGFMNRAKVLGLPQVQALVGVLGGLHLVYERTLVAGIDFTDPEEHLIAFPNHFVFIEERLNKVFHPFATCKIRTIIDAEVDKRTTPG